MASTRIRAMASAALAARRRELDAEREDVTARTRDLVGRFRSEGWSVRDIAGVLGVTPGRVSQLAA